MTLSRENAELSQAIDVSSNVTEGTLFIPQANIVNVSGTVTANTGVFDLVEFNNATEIVPSEGQLTWDTTYGTLDIGFSDTYALHVGQETHFRARNETGGSIYKGQAVYATGVHSDNIRLEIDKYTADGNISELRFIGLVSEDISDNGSGYVTNFGYIRGNSTYPLDTRGSVSSNVAVGDETWTQGDILYVHPSTAGKLTKVAPRDAISVAIIIRVHQTDGVILVRPTSYGHLTDLHDVDTSGVSNGQTLVYNSGNLTWEAGTISGGIANVVEDTTPQLGGNLDLNNNNITGNGQINVDNLRLDGNTISSTNTNGNIVLTPNGNGGIAAGTGATVGGWATVSGGCGNTASGTYSTISGGRNNCASGFFSTVSGGYSNTASGIYSTVSGGNYNCAAGYSTVSGGYINTASGYYSTVSGGRKNSAAGRFSIISGGCCNITNARHSIINGGHRNVIQSPTNECCSRGATIGGGVGHNSSGGTLNATTGDLTGTITCCNAGAFSTIGGGLRNCATGSTGTVGGGRDNTASGSYSTVSGGQSNTALVNCSTVSGGRSNSATANASTVSGGFTNTASAGYASIGGGYNNTVSGYYGTISGGCGNRASGFFHPTIGGGRSNTASGEYSTISGGKSNTASAYYATVGGGKSNAVSATNSTVGGGISNIASATNSTISGGSGNYACGSASTVSGGSSNTASGSISTVSGGSYAKASKYGELSHAAGRFAATGDAQHSTIIARRNTTDATANQVLFLDGSSARLTIPAETTWMFSIKLAAHNDTNNDGAWWTFRGGIRRDASNNTSLIGSVISEYERDTNMATATASVVADDTNEALEIRVTGVAAKNIRWVAVVDISQVSWGTP